MKGVGSLFAAAAALSASLPAHAAAHDAPRDSIRTPHVATVPAPGSTRIAVTGVSVESAAGHTAVVVRVDGAVDVQDFTLEGPRRVVLDLQGAVLAGPAPRYDGATRGGVTNVRVGQFRPGTVRVVVELDGRHPYRVERVDGGVRLVVDGPAGSFAAWRAGAAVAVAPARTVAERAPAERAPVAPKTETRAEPRSESRSGEALAAAASATLDSLARTMQPPVTPRAAAPKARAAREVFPRDRGMTESTRELTPRRAGARLTVTYVEADIRDVLAAFAAFSGRTIIMGREVGGTVTAEIKDQPWEVALAAVLRTQGLAASEDRNGIITVDSYRNLATNRSVEPLVTQVVDVNYAKAGSLVPTIAALLSRDCTMGDAGANGAPGTPRGCLVRGSVMADTATNKLLLTDVPSHLPDVVSRVRELDVRTPQVAIKAKIVFVDRTGLEDIGVSYDLGTGTDQFFSRLVPRMDPSTQTPVYGSDGRIVGVGGGTPIPGDRIALGGNAVSAIANASNAMNPSALNLIYSVALGRFQLTSFINALQQTSLADVQSEPSIVTLNNRTAEIFVGQQIPIRVIDASAGGAGGGGATGGNFPRATVRLQEAGIRLAVTPQVTNNRKVILNVRAENSSAQVGATDVGVVFNQQRADNQLLVADGETAVIGGLTVTERSKNRTGIPYLVDLPLIGRLFGQTTVRETKRDLIILVTPHILDEGERAPIPEPKR